MSCGIDCRCSSDPTLLWLGCRLVAAAPISLGTSICHRSNPKKSKKKKKFYAFFKVQSGHHHLQGAFLALPFIGLGCHSSLHPRFFGIPLITALNGLFLFLDLLEC